MLAVHIYAVGHPVFVRRIKTSRLIATFGDILRNVQGICTAEWVDDKVIPSVKP